MSRLSFGAPGTRGRHHQTQSRAVRSRAVPTSHCMGRTQPSHARAATCRENLIAARRPNAWTVTRRTSHTKANSGASATPAMTPPRGVIRLTITTKPPSHCATSTSTFLALPVTSGTITRIRRASACRATHRTIYTAVSVARNAATAMPRRDGKPRNSITRRRPDSGSRACTRASTARTVTARET